MPLWFILPQYYCLSALFFVIQTRTTHWFQRSPIHTRLTGKSECKTWMRCTASLSFTHSHTDLIVLEVKFLVFKLNLFVLQVQQISKRMDTEVCNVRMPGRSKMRTKETCLIYNLRQMSNRGGKNKLENSPSFGGGSDTMRYSATWLSMCWAATMCCPSWLVWICWAGPDGLLKALPYGIPETLHSPYRHTQTLNCYSCYRDYHYNCCYSYASFSLSNEAYHYATRTQNVWFI